MTNHILSIFEYFHLYVIASPEDFWDVLNIFYFVQIIDVGSCGPELRPILQEKVNLKINWSGEMWLHRQGLK